MKVHVWIILLIFATSRTLTSWSLPYRFFVTERPKNKTTKTSRKRGHFLHTYIGCCKSSCELKMLWWPLLQSSWLILVTINHSLLSQQFSGKTAYQLRLHRLCGSLLRTICALSKYTEYLQQTRQRSQQRQTMSLMRSKSICTTTWETTSLPFIYILFLFSYLYLPQTETFNSS